MFLIQLAVCNCYDPVTTTTTQNPLDPLTAPRRDANAYLNSAITQLNTKINSLNSAATSILTSAKNQNLADQQAKLDQISNESNDLLSLLDYSGPCFYMSEDVINMRSEYYNQINYCTELSLNVIDGLWTDVNNAVTNGQTAITNLNAKYNLCGYTDMTCFTNFKNNAPTDVNAKLTALQNTLNSLTTAANTAAMNGNSCRDRALVNFKTDYNAKLIAINACILENTPITEKPINCFSP